MHDATSLTKAFSLDGRTAVVTGAGSGIGQASAAALAAAGAAVYCADIDGSSAAATAAAIVASGGSAVGLAVDVARRAEVEGLIARAVADTGRLDIQCNVAGRMSESKVLDITDDDLDVMFQVNLRGVLYGCQAAGRFMKDHGGAIACSWGYGISPSSTQSATNAIWSALAAGLKEGLLDTSIPFGGVDRTASAFAAKEAKCDSI